MLTPPQIEDRIPLREKLAFGVGCLFREPGLHALQLLAYPIFAVAMGVNPVFIGLTLGAFRLWDAITDPIMGYVTDNWKSRWGRRKPFILIGGLMSAVIFPIVFWVPRGWGENAVFVYFLSTSLIYYTAFTVFAIPLWAIAMERTPDYKERTVLWSFGSFFGSFGFVSIGWMYPLTQLDYWQDTTEGIRYISLGLGIFWAICSVVPILFMKERFQQTTTLQSSTPIWQGLRQALSNRPFLLCNGLQLSLLVGSGLVEFLGFYLNVYYIHGGDTKPASIIMGTQTTLGIIARFATVPLIPWAAERFGKKGLLYGCMGAFTLIAGLKWVLFTPEAPWLQIIISVANQIPVVIFWTMMPSMISDICDWDELTSKQRREGLFSSVNQWINKTGLALASGVTGSILLFTGFDQHAGGAQTPGTFLMMRLLFSVVPVMFYTIAFLLLRKYPIDAEKAGEIRRELESRRGSI